MPDNAFRDGYTVRPKNTKSKEIFSWGMGKFFDEARTLYTLDHPNVVRVTDVFEANGTAYFVMPYLEGQTLHGWIKEHEHPGRSELVDVFVPLLEALKYVHDHKILHRDVKPENVLILRNGNPVLIDFGSARVAIGAKSKALTQILTPHFAPYEQYASSGTFTPALDIYSLAASMYQAITHELPQEAPARVLEDSLAPLAKSKYVQTYGMNFLTAVDKALSVLPKNRFQDALSFQKALMGEKESVPVGDEEAPPVNKEKTPGQTLESIQNNTTDKQNGSISPSVKKNIPILIAFVFIMLLAVGGFWLWRSGSATVPAPPAKSFTNSIGMQFVLIPAGEFMMGSDKTLDDEYSDAEMPRHRVTISKAFYLGKYEVTQGQWETVMGNNPSEFKDKNRPVEQVSWEDAQSFITRLNEKEGHRRYRLPTEAEWEYAARAGTISTYYLGDVASSFSNYVWFKENSGDTTHPVGQKQPNAWGLYDMHGNVWEWVQDWYGEKYYASSPSVDPRGPSSGSYRVLRGGSWYSSARNCRSVSRSYFSPGNRNDNLGFRLALSPE